MISYEIHSNIPQIIEEFGAMQRKQVPFALRLSLARTAEEARDAARQRVFQRGFTMRSRSFATMIANSIVIERPAASEADPRRRYRFQVITDSRLGKGKRSLMPWLEEGGLRTSPRMLGPLGRAVAIPVRNSPMDVVDRKLYPSATGIGGTNFTIPQRPSKGVQRGSRGQIVGSVGVSGRMKGKRRTFLVMKPGVQGTGTVFQRTGSGPRDIRALFLMRPHARVAGRNFFFPSVERVVRDRFLINFQGALQAALWSGEIGRNRGVGITQRTGVAHPTQSW